MYRIKFLLIAIILSFTLSVKVFPHVGLDYPHGGETFEVGDIVTIEWREEASHGTSDWDLLFTSNGGLTWEDIATDLPKSQLSYDWTVPNVSSNICRIRIVQDNQATANYTDDSGDFTITSPSDVSNNQKPAEKFIFYPAYPNPFNPTTKISYYLPQQSRITLKIYDLLGNEVTTLVNGSEPEGNHELILDASGWTSGIYFYKIQAVAINSDLRNSFVQTKKIILLK